MDLYLVSLATGAVGLGAMAIGGVSHSAGGHAHVGNAHGHAGHAATGSHAGRAHGDGHGTTGWNWSALLSPRLLFSAMVGFGAIGLAAAPLGEPLRAAAALAGAAAFEAFIVGPLWRFLFRFESRAATTLEGSVEEEARAVTSFDVNGNGLVSLDVDGQNIQLLATLSSDELRQGVRIRRGDMVRIAEVDAGRGRCTVTLPSS